VGKKETNPDMRRKNEVTLSLTELAERLDATITGTENPGDIFLDGLSTLQSAGANDLAFVSNEKYLEKAAASKAGALLTNEKTAPEHHPCLVVGNVWETALAALDIWYPDEKPPAGIHPSAVVDPSALLGRNASVGPLAVIEAGVEIGENAQIGAQCFVGRDSIIGANTLLHPGVKVLERIVVGVNCILHSGVVLGADGFGYEVIDGRAVKIPQVGTVVIEDKVEIGANTCVDRAFLTETRIGAGTKIDNLVQIAHNCRIGRSCGLAAQVGVAGSTTVGDGCMFWGQVGVKDNLTIGNRVELMGQCAPTGNIPDGQALVGSPALPIIEQARIFAAQRRLPDLLKRLRAVEKKVEKE